MATYEVDESGTVEINGKRLKIEGDRAYIRSSGVLSIYRAADLERSIQESKRWIAVAETALKMLRARGGRDAAVHA